MANTNIQGALSLALGLGPVTGVIQVANPAFTDANDVFHPASSSLVQIGSDGTYAFSLAPTVESTPSDVYYTATYFIGTKQFTEYWTVPSTSATLTIPQLHINQSVPAMPFQIQASQIYSADANVGDCLVFNGAAWTPVTLQTIHEFEFTAQSTISISEAEHTQGAGGLLIKAYDSSGNELDPAVQVDVLGNVTLYFESETTGYGFIYGGLGRSLPNYSRTFRSQQSVVVKQAQHRFNTSSLAVVVYDSAGNLISAQATIQVAPTFDVTVSFASPMSGKVVVLGCLGVTTPQNPAGGGGDGGSSGNATALNGVALEGSLADGEAYVYSAANNGFYPVAVPYWKKYTVSYSQLAMFDTATQTVTLGARGLRQKVCGVSLYVTQAFGGSNVSALTATVGDSAATTDFYTSTSTNLLLTGGEDFNVLGAPAGTSNLQATFKITGATMSALAEGSVDICVCLVNQP